MLSITDLKTGVKISYDFEPYMILSYSHSKMGRGGAVVKTKMKNLKTGAVIDKTFQGADRLEGADIFKKSATYLYKNDLNAFFMDNQNFEQYEIPLSVVEDNINFLVENSSLDVLYFNDTPINIELPIKMTFKVLNAPPGIKGNSSGSVTKKITIETGLKIDVPLFVKEGDKIVVDTRDGSYVERA